MSAVIVILEGIPLRIDELLHVIAAVILETAGFLRLVRGPDDVALIIIDEGIAVSLLKEGQACEVGPVGVPVVQVHHLDLRILLLRHCGAV